MACTRGRPDILLPCSFHRPRHVSLDNVLCQRILYILFDYSCVVESFYEPLRPLPISSRSPDLFGQLFLFPAIIFFLSSFSLSPPPLTSVLGETPPPKSFRFRRLLFAPDLAPVLSSLRFLPVTCLWFNCESSALLIGFPHLHRHGATRLLRAQPIHRRSHNPFFDKVTPIVTYDIPFHPP